MAIWVNAYRNKKHSKILTTPAPPGALKPYKMPDQLIIKAHQLPNNYNNAFLTETKKGQDLTAGLEIEGINKATIGTQKKVKVFYYEGKECFYKSRKVAAWADDYNATETVVQYLPALNITILGFFIAWILKQESKRPSE